MASALSPVPSDSEFSLSIFCYSNTMIAKAFLKQYYGAYTPHLIQSDALDVWKWQCAHLHFSERYFHIFEIRLILREMEVAANLKFHYLFWATTVYRVWILRRGLYSNSIYLKAIYINSWRLRRWSADCFKKVHINSTDTFPAHYNKLRIWDFSV